MVHKPYTGEPVIQDLEVTIGINGENVVLEEGKDFTATYENNIEVGKTKVVITGIGDYTDSQEREFRVLFKDVSWEHNFHESVYWAADNGITKGYPGTGLFGVNDNMTRSQAVMFLWRLVGEPEPDWTEDSPFPDIDSAHGHYKAVLWAAQNGITTGYKSGPKAGLFGTNDNVTRSQAAMFLWRIAGEPEVELPEKSPFPGYRSSAWSL